MKKYYLHNGAHHQGPFDLGDLKKKQIASETPIWFVGIDEWTTAGKVEELKNIFNTTTTLLSQATSIPPPLSNTEKNSNKMATILNFERKSKGTRKNLLLITGAVIVLLLLSVVIFWKFSLSETDSFEKTQINKQLDQKIKDFEKSQPVKFLTADGEYSANYRGNKLIINGTIKNSATLTTYKFVVVTITYFTKNKTVLDTESYRIFETFSPNSTKDFQLKIENYSKANSIGWEVTDAVIK